MSQQELLTAVVRALEGAGVEYMVTGSIASTLQGEPRATHDIDVVVALQKEAVGKLINAFPPPEFYLDEQSIVEAIQTQRMFNLIHVTSGDKVDFWMLTDTPFDRSRFARRCVEPIGDIRLAVSSPEDTILAKLRWAKLSGGSEKQFTDALRVYEVQFGNLDRSYLRTWAANLGVEQMLERLETEAKVL